MTAHLCEVLDPENCYRCALNLDEMERLSEEDDRE